MISKRVIHPDEDSFTLIFNNIFIFIVTNINDKVIFKW